MPRDGSDFSRPLVPDVDQSVAFCGTEDDPAGEIVPTIRSFGADGRACGSISTLLINNFPRMNGVALQLLMANSEEGNRVGNSHEDNS